MLPKYRSYIEVRALLHFMHRTLHYTLAMQVALKMFSLRLLQEIKISWWLSALSLVTLFSLFQIIRGIYRITMHPLAKFPGPKLTAMTRWYEAYYEIVAGGEFGNLIGEWHKRYGPIVRINPFEVHIVDSDYYDVLFNFDPHLEKRCFAIGKFLRFFLACHLFFGKC